MRYLLACDMNSYSEERPHKCGVCDKGFKNLVILQDHANMHTSTRPHCCRECESSFTTSWELARHVHCRHTQEKHHRCTECNYACVELYNLKLPQPSHTRNHPHKSGVYDKGSQNLVILQDHANTHTLTRPHCCRECESSFFTRKGLVMHVRYNHTHEKPHRCTVCDYASVVLSNLKRHMRRHDKKHAHQCPHCTYAVYNLSKLKNHLRIHTGERPYKCDICQLSFTWSSNLKEHLYIHLRKKPSFNCDLCPTTFTWKRHLQKHIQRLHTTDTPLQCKRCVETFPDGYSYKLHSKTHKGEKCFKCALCLYATVSRSKLASHMLIHTNQRPFRCDECNQAFKRIQGLRQHEIVHRDLDYVPPSPKEKTIECPECGKAYERKGNLIRHMTIEHPEASEKEETLKIRESKGPGEIPNGEEEEYYVKEKDEVETPNFSGTLIIAEQGKVKETEDGQRVVVSEAIQLHPQDHCESEMSSAHNGETVSLTTLWDVTENCCASAMAGAIEAVESRPSSPVEEVSVEEIVKETSIAMGRQTSKRKWTEVSKPPAELVNETSKKGRPVQTSHLRKVEEVPEEEIVEETFVAVDQQTRKRRFKELSEPPLELINESDDAQILPEFAALIVAKAMELDEPLTEMDEQLTRIEAVLERRTLEQKQKDIDEWFGFNDAIFFEAIQLQDQEQDSCDSEMPTAKNEETVSLTTLQDVAEEDCFDEAVAEAIVEVEPTPSSPVDALVAFQPPAKTVAEATEPDESLAEVDELAGSEAALERTRLEQKQKVVVFKAIQHQDQEQDPDESVVHSSNNRKSVSLTTLQDTTEEDCFDRAVAEAIGAVVPMPSFSVMPIPERERNKKKSITLPQLELLKDTKGKEIPVEEMVKETTTFEPIVPSTNNGETVSLMTLHDVTDENCFDSTVAEVNGEAEHTPSSPVEEVPVEEIVKETCIAMDHQTPKGKWVELLEPPAKLINESSKKRRPVWTWHVHKATKLFTCFK